MPNGNTARSNQQLNQPIPQDSSDQLTQTRRGHLRGIAGVSAALLGLGSSGAAAAAPEDATDYDDICFTPTTVLAKQIRDGELSPVEIVDAFLTRIEEQEDDLNAFITLIPEQAREHAKEAERAVERGDELGPLHGVPFGVKDLDGLEGVTYTEGHLAFEDRVAEETDENVQSFIDAGAIPIGTTNTPEWGYTGKTDNLLVGPTSTPFEIGRNSGGSSGGSAAAVADGLVPFATGGDGAGSIRIPASFTGTYGLFKRIDNPGEFGTGSTYVRSGTQTRTVADTALTLSVMTEDDEGATDYQAALDQDVDGLSIGYSPDLGIWPVDERVRTVVGEGVETITEAGATVDNVEVDVGQSFDEFMDGLVTTWSATYAMNANDLLEEDGLDLRDADRELFPEPLVELVETGDEHLDEDGEYLDESLAVSIETRSRAYAGIQSVLADHDLLVTPTLAVPPFSNEIVGPTEIEGVETHPILGWLITAMFNMTGHPAGSVPAGQTDDGLPVGMQIVGPSQDDSAIVAASVAYEEVNPWRDEYHGLS